MESGIRENGATALVEGDADAQFHGHLHLRAESRPGSGVTHLAQRSFRAPLSLSKTYRFATGALLAQVVNPTAGLFAGDQVELRAEAGPGADFCVTTPAASRVFRARRPGGLALTRQEFTVEAGGWLEYSPELFIPHAGSAHRQETRMEIALEGGLFYLETLAPGRVASGEVFGYRRLEFHAEIRRGGELVYRERNALAPEEVPHSLHSLRALYPQAYFLNALFCPPHGALTLPVRDFQEALAALSAPGAIYCGAALLRDGQSWAIRALTADSLALRRLAPQIRELAHAAIGRSAPNLRKL